MEKPALNTYNVHPLIKRRWSPRAFEEKMVEREKLQNLFEAARWAPSSFNQQPWKFIVGIKGTTTYDNIMDTLVDFNKSWAKLAPVLVLTVGKEKDSNGKSNSSFKYDTGQSVAYLTFQAMQENLFVHQMGGFEPKKAISNFSIEDDYKPLTVLAIGYIGEPGKLPEDLQEAEKGLRTRNDHIDYVFEEKFGNKSSIF